MQTTVFQTRTFKKILDANFFTNFSLQILSGQVSHHVHHVAFFFIIFHFNYVTSTLG